MDWLPGLLLVAAVAWLAWREEMAARSSAERRRARFLRACDQAERDLREHGNGAAADRLRAFTDGSR